MELNKVPENTNFELSINSSLGCEDYSSNFNASNFGNEGVPHVFDIICSSGLIKTESIVLRVSSSTNKLHLVLGKYFDENLSFQLYTDKGELLENKKINEVSTVVEMDQLPCATYIIIVSEHNHTIKSFKFKKY